MGCMKCGKDITDDNVFCADCLLEMEKYPVDPGTVVLLPRRKESSAPKKQTKRHVSAPEEQIAALKKRVLILTLLLIVCAAAIVLMFEPTMHYVRDEHFEIGQNYSSVTPSSAPTTPSPTE